MTLKPFAWIGLADYCIDWFVTNVWDAALQRFHGPDEPALVSIWYEVCGTHACLWDGAPFDDTPQVILSRDSDLWAHDGLATLYGDSFDDDYRAQLKAEDARFKRLERAARRLMARVRAELALAGELTAQRQPAFTRQVVLNFRLGLEDSA